MGFKPRGDDARPDRGLPPFARMLIGKGNDLLTVVYGPASTSTWDRLHNNPRRLINNGLWESIFDVSDGLLVDASTDGIRRHGYLRTHWHQERAQPGLELLFVEPRPLNLGENDVDTVLHLLLARHGGASVFEGMCNPPGGDWSGISLQMPDRAAELRWLTRPRVSIAGDKRPDHVFQFFDLHGLPIILCIESKETVASVGSNIGPRLKAYLQTLTLAPASIERPTSVSPWRHSTSILNTGNYRMASAAAFKMDTDERIASVKQRAEVDLLLCFAFGDGGASCQVRVIPCSPTGEEIAALAASLRTEGIGINVTVDHG